MSKTTDIDRREMISTAATAPAGLTRTCSSEKVVDEPAKLTSAVPCSCFSQVGQPAEVVTLSLHCRLDFVANGDGSPFAFAPR
jgi:hypothetical protein